MNSPQNKGVQVSVPALRTYSKNLGYYKDEADAFDRLIDTADVTNESWGLVGIYAKGKYTEKLDELRELLTAMRDGVEAFADKLEDAAEIYQGNEDDASMTFGHYQAEIDGPRD